MRKCLPCKNCMFVRFISERIIRNQPKSQKSWSYMKNCSLQKVLIMIIVFCSQIAMFCITSPIDISVHMQQEAYWLLKQPGCIPCTSHAGDAPRVWKMYAKRPPRCQCQETAAPTSSLVPGKNFHSLGYTPTYNIINVR